MKFCRRVARQLFFEQKKADKRHIKELIKGSIHNLLNNSLQKILLSAAGITLLTQPLFGASKSTITNIGNQTKIEYNNSNKTHTITTTSIKGKNAFNAFKDFTLKSGEIANLQFPTNTDNLVNFVKNKIDIEGTLNAVKNNNHDGNLFFVSSKGFVLGKSGVINAGAYYSLNRNNSFMDKFIKGDKLNIIGVDDEINTIVGSRILNLDNQTSVNYDKAKKTHTITTTAIKDRNAFNAFSEFTLISDEIAIFMFPENTDRILNFVRDKIDIRGTVNAIRDNRIGGDLYFLSSEGLILGKGGVINAGAFYAMTPTKGFMEKFIGKDSLNLSSVDNEIDYIVNRKISNYNERYDYGVTINPYGEIIIEGKINTINGIGLYAGGVNKEETASGTKIINNGLTIGENASLNTFDKNHLSSFVNLDGINLPQATDIVENEGKIELVSVQDNTHQDSKIFEYFGGYTSFSTADAYAKIESDGIINSRNDVTITAYASNGHVNWIKTDEDTGELIKSDFEKVANIASITSSVSIGGKVFSGIGTATGTINIHAISDNQNELKTVNFCALGLEILGTLTPFNIDANVLKSSASSNVNIKSNATIEAQKYISIAAKTNSSSVAGACTSKFVTNKAASSNLSLLPIISSAVNIQEASSKVSFDGTAISHLDKEDEIKEDGKVVDTKKSISILSESNSSLGVNSKSKSMNTQAWGGAAVSVGKNKNTAVLNIGQNADFDAKKSINLTSVTNSDNSVTAECELRKTGYAVPVVAVSLFDSDATANVQGNINAKSQEGTFTINVNNNINSDELCADSGLQSSPWEWEKFASDVKKESIDKLFETLHLGSFVSNAIPNPSASKFGIAAAVAYGSGKHNSSLNIKPGALINTAGSLELSSLTYVNDVKYDSTANIYCCEDHQGSKFQSSIAFLYNNFDYTSNVIIDDSVNPNTSIIGKEVSIESEVYQPYRRPQAMWEEVEAAWKKVKDYFHGSEHADTVKRVGDSFKKLNTLVVDPSKLGSEGNNQQAAQVWREITDAFDSLLNFIEKEGVLTQDSLVGRFITSAKKLFEFTDYSNFLNYSVSSSVNTIETGENQPFSISGSIYYGNNSSKSNILIGKKAVINASDSCGISIKSTSDVTSTVMLGGPPILYHNNQGKNAAGGSVLVHNNNSEANFLAASGATIGSNEIDNLDIITMNNFTPIDLTMGTSSITNGFNGMLSVVVGKSHSNLKIDDGTNLGGKKLNLYSYNNTNADNIVGALTISEKKGVGVGLAVTVLDKENQILVQDNDKDWQELRKKLGLRTDDPDPSEYVYEPATFSADIFNAVSKTTGTINTIGVAGGVAVDDKSKYDKFTTNINRITDAISVSGIDAGVNIATYWALGKLLDLVPSNRNVPGGAPDAPDPDPDVEREEAENEDYDNDGGVPQQQPGAANADLSLTFNGSAAANSIKNYTKVIIENTNVEFFNDAASATFNASAINSAHTLSFSGAAGIMAQGGNGTGVSVGLDGSVAVNKINNTTETSINKTHILEANQLNAISIDGGESIAAGLGLQVIAASHNPDKSGSGAVNASINLINNTVKANVKDSKSTSSKSSNSTNMVVTAYESDTQVTGGVSAAVGKQKGAVGVSIDISKIKNTLSSEINGGTYEKMKNVEVNALQASTIVNAGIAVAVAAGVNHDSFAVSGSGVYSNLKNTSTANIKNATISGDSVAIRAQDVRTSDKGVSTYEDNLVRNGKNLDFIEKEGKAFYTNLETATGTTELGDQTSKRKGSLLVTASISGAYSGTAVGLGAAINQIVNSYNINVEGSIITSKKFDANAISYTDAITVGAGAAVSSERNKGSGFGSAAWNSIANTANVTFSNNTIKSDSLNLKTLNDSTLVGVGGAISIGIKGTAAVGASVAYNGINNSANSLIYGGSVTGVSSDSSSLIVNAENSSRIWGIALSVAASEKVAVAGTVSVNEIENNATASVGSSTAGLTNISSLKLFEVIATDSANIKSLSGAVTGSGKVSIGGAVTVNHISGSTESILDKVKFFANESNIRAYSESNNLSLAAGLGGSGSFAFDGAAVNNDVFRDVKTSISNSTTDNASATFNTSATAIGNTGSLAAAVCGAKDASAGAGISVNRMGGDVKTTLKGNNFKVKDLSAKAYSNQEITTIGIAGSGGGLSLSGSIAYNSIAYNTIAEAIDNILLSAENNIAIKAVSDDILKNYAGMLNIGIGIPSGGGGGAAGDDQNDVAGLDDQDDDNNPIAPNAADNRSRFRKMFDGYSSALKSGNGKMGSVSGKMGGVGFGVSVSVNEIDGKTNATLSGGKIEALGKNSSEQVTLNNVIKDSDINHKYVDSSTICINSSLAGKRETEKRTGLVVDSSSTHTTKSFLASIGVSGKAAANANVNVNYVGGETNATFDNATVNDKKDGKTAGNISVKATDYTNTAGFVGNVSLGGKAGIGLSADTNKVVRTINAKVSDIKEGSVADNLEVKAISKQGISSVVAGLAASLQVGVAGNIDVALLDSTTKALVENSKISVNSLDVEANHYARAHELAVAAGIGAGTAGVGAAVVVNNDINTVYAGVGSSTINANSGSNGAFKVNSINDDDFETVTGAGGAGMYAGVAGAVAVDYMENNVETNVATSTFGNVDNRAGSVEIKSKDVSKQVSKGGSVGIGGYAGVGAIVEVNTLDGQTNTKITNSNIYATNNIDLGASEQRDSGQFAVSVSAGLAGVGANVLVINSGKKMDLSDSGSNDANTDTKKALGMADEAVSTDYKFNDSNTFTDKELEKIFSGKPTYTAANDGKAITLTKIDRSIIDSKSGKISSNNIATGTLNLSNNGGAGGAGAVLGCFGYVYDNKNVVTSVTNSHLNAGDGIDVKSITGGKSELSLVDAVAGIGDYAGAFGYVKMAGNTSIGVAGSRLINTKNSINILSLDESSGKADSRGYTFGGVGIGTIIAKAKNDSSSDVTISNSRIANKGNYTASNTVYISAEKNNSLNAIGYSGSVSAGTVAVVSTLAEDKGKSNVDIKKGNYFVSNEFNVLASNRPVLNSKMYSWSGSVIGVGVGDVTTREYGSAKLKAVDDNNYKVNTVNMGAVMDSESSQISEAYTVSVGVDVHVNKADTLSSSNVDVDVNIGKDDFDKKTILNIYAENNASATMDVYGVAVGGILSVANNEAKAIASLTTNLNVSGSNGSNLSQINSYSSSDAYHKLHANGDGGGLISISPCAAYTDSKVILNTNTNLSNNLSANKISANAIGNAKTELTSDATQGEFAGGCGTEATLDYNVNTNVNLNDNSNINANIVDLKAQNNFITESERSGKNNKTKSYGFETGARIDSNQKIQSTAQVNVGKKTNILASEEINIDAKTTTDLLNKIQVGGAGFGSHLGAHSKNDLTFNNNIYVNEDSKIKTNKKDADINIGASYDIKGDFSSYSEVEGAGEGNSLAEIINDITNNNTIDINGEIYSYNDINLYTDQDTNGISSKYYLNNNSEAYTRAVIPWETSAKIKNNLVRNNTINLNLKSNLKSVRHIVLSSGYGDFNIKNYTKEYNWYKTDTDGKSADYATVSEGESSGALKENDIIKVDGKVTAGIHNNIDINIDGLVAFDTNVTGDGIVRSPTIVSNNEEYNKDSFKTGTMNYGNALFERYKEIEGLCIEYSGTIVGLNYEAEKVRLENEMLKYGLYDPSTKSVIGKLDVEYIELPDMVSSGGNIYINAKNTDSVSGGGTLKAQGAPQIKVDNNSNLYMKVNDLTVVEPGGDIVFNNKSLANTASKELSNVTKVETDDAKGSKIEVNENWKGSYDVKYKNPDDGKTYDLTHSPLTNIEINGHIDDEYGKVVFYNASKDIVLQGKTAKDSASVNGAAISISAPNGSIAQGYTQGITNIGYTPEAVLKQYAKTQEASVLSKIDQTSNTNKSQQNTLSKDNMQSYIDKYKTNPTDTNNSQSGVWLAGGSIFLNGDDINLNGTIQSGYSEYEVTLSDKAIESIKSIQEKYKLSGKPEITQSYLEQNCRINNSGMTWDKNAGAYKYIVQAYYNPKTDSIILEDITTQGGRIYLTGRISNTFGGKIYAADGSSNITINNNTGYKLIAKTLDVGDRKGFISIMDLAKNDESKGILATLTEMTSDSTKVWNVKKGGIDRDNPDSTSGLASYYNPLSGLTYNWTTGYDVTTEYKYEESYKFTVWGLFDYGSKCSSTMMQKIQDGNLSPSSSGGKDKKKGNYIGAPQVACDDGYSIYLENKVNYTDGPHSGGRTEYNSFLHFSGTQYQWSTYKQGSSRVYQHAIKADYPISINFLKGNGYINLTTNSDLQLNSDVISKYGEVTLTTTNGSIEQHGGKFITDNIYLNATTGIGANEAITQKMQSGSGVFSAITQSGNVNLISNNYGALKDTTLKLTALTDNGNTSVVADASLLRGDNSLDVKGSRIDLTSNYGSIGTKGALLKINAGQEMTKPGVTLSASINAQAYGDIALNQTEGDMRLGKIVSDTGDVYLTSAGSVLDALPPSAKEKDNQTSEKMIEKWKELGIISVDGKDNSSEKRQEAITAYENSVKTSFARYLGLKERFDKDKNDTTSDSYNEYQTLEGRFKGFSSADEWLDAQYKDKNSQWYKLNNEVVFGWTQDALLYAIQDSIINREEGSTIAPVTPDDANIKARNVVINAGGGIGRDEGYTVVDISNLQSEKGLEALKAIAGSEASDVKWGYDGDKVDSTKATINKVNALKINANGTLEASAKDNIYFEDVNNNAINLISVSSNEGNVRVYGNNGIYNATAYKEGDANNVINLSGKDLIVESGNGSIGSATVPLTTNMFGAVTARSNDLINIFQVGNNAITFAQAYSGSYINIRAIKDIFSVYNGVQAEELGYIHSKDDMTLYSYEGDIGQSDGKGLRVKLEKDKYLNAEAESVYLKGYGDTSLDLGKIIARSGDIGIESKTLDFVLKDDISAQNLEFRVRSINQEEGKLTVGNRLLVTADNGIILDNSQNYIPEASLINNKSGAISLSNNRDLTLYDAVNKAEDGDLFIVNEGSVTAKNGLCSEGYLFVWANGDIDIQKDSSSKKWTGLYAENGGIKTKSLFAESVDFSVEKNGLTTENVIAENQIKANVESGDIQTEVVASDNDGVTLITHDGNITSSEILAKKDINIIAYNGDLNVNNSINSINGFIEAVGYKSLSVDSIKAAQNLYIGSLGDVIITSLMSGVNNTVISDIFDDLNIKENTSYLLGKNIKVDNVVAYDYFEAISKGKFTVSDKIIAKKDVDITAHNEIEINSVKSVGNLDIASVEEGAIKINESITEKGNISVSNEIGDIELGTINAGGDVLLNNVEKGDIIINDSIKTQNNGSLYVNVEDGDLYIKSGDIEGDVSVYSEQGDMELTNITVQDELDARTKDGSIYIISDTYIGKDATLKSDTGKVVLAGAKVGGDLKLSANKSAEIVEAAVDGSMLMKGDEEGCFADILKVGKDLVLNTQTGSVRVENITVGENTYISIDSNGGNVEIINIETGKDSVGDLIVNSNSISTDYDNPKYVKIDNAFAANKIIINSSLASKVILNTAKADQGKLEVKAFGDISAEIVRAAKDIYITTFAGIIDITRVIAGDSITVMSLAGKLLIDNIETLNPEADIDLFQGFGELSISNASSSRDLEFTCVEGSVKLDKVSTGGSINITAGALSGEGVTIDNSLAAKDINIDIGPGNINITNTNIGNNLNVNTNGEIKVSDVQVGNNSIITTNDNSIANIDRFNSFNLEIKDNGKSDANISNSNIGNVNVELGGNLTVNNLINGDMTANISGYAEISNLTSENFTANIHNSARIIDSNIDNINARIDGNISIDELTNKVASATIRGDAFITNSKIDKLVANITSNTTLTNVINSELTADIKGKALINKLTGNKNTDLIVGKDASIKDSEIANLNADIKGNANINNLINNDLTAKIGGDVKINNLTGNKSADLTVDKDTSITDSDISSLNAQVGGDLIITNLTNSQMYANASGSTKFTNLTSNEITAKIDKDALITNSNIEALTASVGGIATFTDSTIGNIKATVTGDLTINNLINDISSLEVGANTTIASLTSNDLTATIGKDLTINESSIGKLSTKVMGDADIGNLLNTELVANVGGDVKINNLTGNKSTDLTVGKNTSITDSEISSLNAQVGGDLTLTNLTNSQISANVSGSAIVTNLTSDEVTAQIGKDALITNSNIEALTASVGGIATFTDSTIGNIKSNVTGDLAINNLVNNISSLEVSANTTIASITSNDLTATIGGNTQIADSSISKLNANSGGNLTLANLSNKQMNAVVGGNADVSNLTSKDSIMSVDGNATIDASEIIKFDFTVKNGAQITNSDIDSMKANLDGMSLITDSNFKNIDLTNAGEALIKDSTVNSMVVSNAGKFTLNKLKSSIVKLDLNNTGEAIIESNNVNSFVGDNSGQLNVNDLTGDKLELTSSGNTNIDVSNIKSISANNSGKLDVKGLTSDKLLLTSSGVTNIADDSSIKSIKANNSGELNVNSLTSDKLELTSSGNTNIASSSIESINSINSGKLDVNELTSDKLELTSKGNTNIAESNIKAITANNSGELNVNRLTSDKLELNSSKKANLADSNIINVNVNNSGIADINILVSNHLSFVNSGSATINATIADKMKFTNSGKTILNNIEVNNSAYVINNNGNLNIDQLNVANNFDLDSKSGSINMSGIDITNDFNFALKGDSGVKFTDITIGHDFNIYAGKAVLNGSTLNVENNLNTYTYSKYSAPKSSFRTAIKQNNGTTKASENEEGFTLILKELNIGGGLYVDNPDVTIEVEQSKVKQDVKIDSGKENIDIKKLDVEGGSLDIKGDSGAIKLGDVTVDNNTNINLGSGNLVVASLTSTLGVDFNVGGNITSGKNIKSENSTVNAVAGGNLTASTVEAKDKVNFKAGGNITSDKNIKSENSTVNAVAGGNLTASTVEARGKIDFKAGGNISSDQYIETQNESVNMIAGGSINAYKVLAQQQGNIEAVNGDIIIGQIDGRTLVFKQDTNDKTLRIREANVETKITASADYIDIEKINHNGTEAPLDIEFGLINSRAMDNVVIKEVKTAKGVDMFNLISMYGNIFVDNSHFDLTKTYLLKMGDLKTPDLKFRIFGDNPKYDKGPDIIAFFAPKVNHKMYANISFEDNEKSGRQDYIPLIAKGSYKKMFNQYTVVQEIYALHLAYEERIEDVDDESYNKFDYRKLDNSKSFYVEPNADIYSDGETVNLDDVDIPVAIEFDSVNGELKAVGTPLKPQPAVD